MRILIQVILLQLMITSTLSAQSFVYRLEAMLETGDLIFQDLDCGLECDAIEAVTEGYGGYDFSHVGMVKRSEDTLWVGEAIGSGVQWTLLASFIDRCVYEKGTPQILVMRLQPPADSLIPGAIAFMEQQIGKAYDPVYTYGDSVYYCSELLYDAFGEQKDKMFSLSPMTFKEPGSDSYFKVWVDYFQEQGHPIPEGEPGINPGSMSRSPFLQPIFVSGLEKAEGE